MKAAGTKATKKDGRRKEGERKRFLANAAILKNALAHERSLRLIQRSGVEWKAISTSIKPGTCVADEMLRKFYWNRA